MRRFVFNITAQDNIPRIRRLLHSPRAIIRERFFPIELWIQLPNSDFRCYIAGGDAFGLLKEASSAVECKGGPAAAAK